MAKCAKCGGPAADLLCPTCDATTWAQGEELMSQQIAALKSYGYSAKEAVRIAACLMSVVGNDLPDVYQRAAMLAEIAIGRELSPHARWQLCILVVRLLLTSLEQCEPPKNARSEDVSLTAGDVGRN